MVGKNEPPDLFWSNKVPENLKVSERARPYVTEYFENEDGTITTTKKEDTSTAATDTLKEETSVKKEESKGENVKVEAKDSKFEDRAGSAKDSKFENRADAVKESKEDVHLTSQNGKEEATVDERVKNEGVEDETQNVEDEIPSVTAEVVDDPGVEENKEKVFNAPKLDESDYENPPLIYREGWGAVKPKSIQFQASPVSILIFTDTKTPECHSATECATTVERLQQKHIRQGLDDIRYNFLLGGDGYVYQGRGFNSVPYLEPKHKKFEARSLVFAYIGTFPDKKVGQQLNTLGIRFMAQSYLQERITSTIEIALFDREPMPLNLLDQKVADRLIRVGIRFMGLCYLQGRITPTVQIALFDKELDTLNMLGGVALPK